MSTLVSIMHMSTIIVHEQTQADVMISMQCLACHYRLLEENACSNVLLVANSEGSMMHAVGTPIMPCQDLTAA